MEDLLKKGGVFDGIAGVLIRSFFMGVALQLVWFCSILFGAGWIRTVSSQWFGITPREFEIFNYYGMAFLKLCLFMFFLIPYLAIKMMMNRK